MILSSRRFGSVEEEVEEGDAIGLAVVVGVVALAGEDWLELGAGLEVAAGLAGRFHAAVELGGSGAHAVAEHAVGGFSAELGHARGLVVGG